MDVGNKPKEEVDSKRNSKKLDDAISMFPQECIYMRWQYGDPTTPGNQKIMNWYSEKGLKVMAATAASAGDSPFLPRDDSRSHYIKAFSTLTSDNKLEGILATAWDDGSPHLETVMRGFIAQGEFGWNPYAKKVEDFKKAHSQREFGLRADLNKTQFIQDLESAAFYFDGALVSQGRRNPAWGATNFTLIELPDKNNPGVWSEKYKEKIENAKKEKLRTTKIDNDIEWAKSNSLRNRYTLDIYKETNNLITIPVDIILSLHNYDISSNESERAKAVQNIQKLCDDFYNTKNQIIDVYSKTRFMSNPEGYIADHNHHNHLSAKTNNSDWIFLYEIPMINNISKWINR